MLNLALLNRYHQVGGTAAHRTTHPLYMDHTSRAKYRCTHAARARHQCDPHIQDRTRGKDNLSRGGLTVLANPHNKHNGEISHSDICKRACRVRASFPSWPTCNGSGMGILTFLRNLYFPTFNNTKVFLFSTQSRGTICYASILRRIFIWNCPALPVELTMAFASLEARYTLFRRSRRKRPRASVSRKVSRLAATVAPIMFPLTIKLMRTI
ncbi:hypothetical protein EDC31_12049 [Acidomonas methanolica]|nr:hypothetical protein EDC31_12049 [Acidomonas methanolica]